MKTSCIPHKIQLEIIRWKLVDIEVDLAGLKGHMDQLPTWSARCKLVDKAIKHLRKWRMEI
jgi:hypothetical protein